MTVPDWYRQRNYLHFDPALGQSPEVVTRVTAYVSNSSQVAKHSFYPFIEYTISSTKLTRDTGKLVPKTKERPIAYAAHLDSHIYSYYAKELSQRYEEAVIANGTSENVLAFRSLGKSNIDFAKAAFDRIATMGNCGVVAVDISKFFDTLDHQILKNAWAELLGLEQLPEDHYAIFRSLTRFSTVNRELLYKELNLSPHKKPKEQYRLCEPKTFRDKIRKAGLVNTNTDAKGIPQGSPLSALLSNIYMIAFDKTMSGIIDEVGGTYFRYCDDMLFIVPLEHTDDIETAVIREIDSLKLHINPKKTCISRFEIVKPGVQTADKPMQYLGFLYDGQKILLRSASLARFSQRMKGGVKLAKSTKRKRDMARLRRGQPAKPLFKRKLYERYSHLGKRNFLRYGYRAAEIMDSDNIRKQLKPLWRRLEEEIEGN